MENGSNKQAYIDLIAAQYIAALTGQPLIRVLFRGHKPEPAELISFIPKVVSNE